MTAPLHTSQAVVDLSAYAHNLAHLRACAGSGQAVVAVVKADGYGLGALPVARRALETGAAMLGVATAAEGVALREAGIDAPVLVLMQPDYAALPAIVAHGLTPMLCDANAARLLDGLARQAGTVLAVHCMVDTGMGRQGFAPADAIQELPDIVRLANLRLDGIATHYPIADSPSDPFTAGQIARLKAVLAALKAAGVVCGTVHGANSAGAICFPDAIFTMVRAGILCYGVWPTDEIPDPNPLRPVLRWATRVSQVKTLEPGHSVSYRRTYITEEGMTAAILPVGYADGYPLALSNKAEVLIRGRRCPVRGRVCMDQTVVDVSHVPGVAVGDEAVLAGVQGDDHVTLEELAEYAGTIPYEILTGIGARVSRVYVN